MLQSHIPALSISSDSPPKVESCIRIQGMFFNESWPKQDARIPTRVGTTPSRNSESASQPPLPQSSEITCG